jgi:hypothetical protein
MTTTPDQHPDDERGRPAGGVRGAINDLLGRGDRTDDDRRTENERLAQERSGAGHDAGTSAPPGTRFEDRPADEQYGADPRTGQQPADAPAGARAEGQHADQQYGNQQYGDQQYGGAVPAGGTRGDGVVGAAAPQQQDVGRRQQGEPYDDPGARGAVPGSARHSDVGPDGPGYGDQSMSQAQGMQSLDERERAGSGAIGSAGARTVDVGGPGDGPAAATGPVSTDRASGDPDRREEHAGSNGNLTGAGAGTQAGAGSVADTSQGEDSEGRERLVSAERAESYSVRWDAVKVAFVDEPSKAVADADALVGELLAELQSLFSDQRSGIERSLAADETSTEDMRLALRRYRSFFDRLLSI